MTQLNDRMARLPAFWDALADFPLNEAEAARAFLLRELCDLFNASNIAWIAAVRMGEGAADDPLRGWRVRAVHYLHPTPALRGAVQKYLRNHERLQPDITAIRFYENAGLFRVMRLRELVDGPQWFEGDYYRWFYREGLNCADGVRIGIPVNADVEAGFAVTRDARKPAFSHEDCAWMTQVLRGLRWFHRQQLLAHGLLLANGPLTATEQRVLQGLLQGKTAKDVAAKLKQSPNTTNEYVRRLYRKFGVKNRAELMALWLGQLQKK